MAHRVHRALFARVMREKKEPVQLRLLARDPEHLQKAKKDGLAYRAT